ncbi:MAG: hypothetical protein AVDCRST_MAG86-1340 [uncultured Truepera sp.]|uniref:Uncharacterized protein n=1 Tax=uncultured Truepera sp. TaxID=543023 RepID=A0A6J4V3T4_9DEIN|nr:MAG: hypothetical protein AVDCRST_MAG86-1340 [uncultured Truepera sp.]
MVGGGLLALGVATRYLGLLLALTMLGAVVTAGRIDGGSHLILPPILGLLCLLCLLFATRGSGAWQLLPNVTRGVLHWGKRVT